MRTFVITCPGLSAGKPGTVVTAETLQMDDDKLDVWCEKGFGVEIHEAVAPAASTPVELDSIDGATPVEL